MPNPVGRPPKYTDPKEVDKIVDAYIASGEKTLTGLVWALGFADKHTFYEYAKKPEFSHSIKRGLLWIEKCYEAGLNDPNVAGRIFALKNFGWKDESHQNVKSEVEMNVTTKQSNLDERIELLRRKN